MHISSPKKYYQLKENLFEQSLLLVVSVGGEGCWLPNWKVGGQQERREGAFRVNGTFLPAAVPMDESLLWAELHPLLCTNTNPHSVKVAVFGLTVAVVQGCPGGLGSACPHEMGFQFIIIIIYNKSRFIFLYLHKDSSNSAFASPAKWLCTDLSLFGGLGLSLSWGIHWTRLLGYQVIFDTKIESLFNSQSLLLIHAASYSD